MAAPAAATPDLEANRTASTIWLVGLGADASPARQLTNGPGDSAPRWAPCGTRIAFTRGGSIFVMEMAGGEPAQLCPLEVGGALWALNNYEWSPDGRWIALVSRGPAGGRQYEPTVKMGDAADDMFVADRIFYKWNKGYNGAMQRDGSYTATHVFLVAADGSGEPRQLTTGEQDDHSLCWAPDSSEIAFVSNRTGDCKPWRLLLESPRSEPENGPVGRGQQRQQ